MDAAVAISESNGIRRITFDRPEKLNALTYADLIRATQAVSEIGPTTSVVVFSGEGGKAFSAGIHIDTFLKLVQSPSETREVIGAVREFLDAVRDAEVPTICAIDGYCLGAAMELAMACDFRVVAAGSQFGLPEINLGLPCILDAALLQQYVGLSRAKEIILTGDLYSGELLDSWGFVNYLVEPRDFESTVEQLAIDIAKKPSIGMASQKRLFRVWQNEPLDAANDASLDEISSVMGADETKRAVEQIGAQFRPN